MHEQVTIDPRFRGPPDSGNGGYVAGLLARSVDGAAEVTLRRPPPLVRPLDIARRPDGGAILCDGGEVVAEAAPALLDIDDLPSAL